MRARRWGILVKSPRQLELMSSLAHLALDKTGTLTEGRFRLRQITLNRANPSAEVKNVMTCAAAVEKNSSHPIAAAFLEYADSLGVSPPPAPDFQVLEGEGLQATVGGTTVHVGNERLARRVLAEAASARGVLVPTRAMEEAAERLRGAEEAATKAEGMPARMAAALARKVEV